MEKLAIWLTNYILSQNVIKQEDYEIYRYGFQSGLEQSSCVVVCVIAAVFLDALPECFLLMTVFFLQRAYMDGIHMRKFFFCFLLSVSVIVCGLAAVKNVCLPDVTVYIAAMSFLLVVKYVSGLHVIVDEDVEMMRYYFRQKKRVVVLITFLLTIFFVIHYSSGLLVILYTELILFVSVLVGFRKKQI